MRPMRLLDSFMLEIIKNIRYKFLQKVYMLILQLLSDHLLMFLCLEWENLKNMTLLKIRKQN